MKNPEYPALPPASRWNWQILWLFGIVLLSFFLSGYAAGQERLYSTTGLRFSEVLGEEELQAVAAYQGDKTNDSHIYASFWGEGTATVKVNDERSEEDVICIGFYGEAADCLPARYLRGGAPGNTGKTCAISDGLAESLYGSVRVEGLQIGLEGELYEITGVFSARDKVVLYPSRKQLVCAELRGVSADTPRADVEQWCAAAGLPAPRWIRYGPQRIMIVRFLCWLPEILTLTVLLIAGIRMSISWGILARSVLWFALAMGGALTLPVLLHALPGWLVPSQWSDFSFWSNLWEEIGQNSEDWKTAVRYWRDYAQY